MSSGRTRQRTPYGSRVHKRGSGHAWRVVVVIAVLVAVGALVGFPLAERAYYKLAYEPLIQQAADEYQVNPYWIAAMIKCESDFDPEAVSKAGAIGLMQMMEDTADDVARWGLVDTDRYDPANLTDPETSINYGTAYLRYLVEYYHEMNPAIAAYNAGMGNVDAWLEGSDDVREVIEFAETEKYLEAVNRAKESYERLYPDAFTWDSAD